MANTHTLISYRKILRQSWIW